MKLILNSPFWYILLCIAVGVLGAFLLYRKDKNLGELSSVWKKILVGLRFVSIFFLSFLLLEPLLEFSKEKVEKPIVILANDNSESIVFSKDSLEVKKLLSESFDKLEKELSTKYEVVSYSFGEEITEGSRFDFSAKSTNISVFFKEIQNRYYNRNLGGVVLASDGIFNEGSNPLFETKKLKNIPVYTVALGDTATKKDLFIEQVSHNRLVYKGNKFPVIVEVKAEQFTGRSSTVKITKGNRVVAQQAITFEGNSDLKQISFELTSEGAGLQKYTVSVSELAGEFSRSNNYKSFFIDVLESKEKILLLANSPHPDVNAIKSALQSNENYEIDVELIDVFKGQLEEYNLVVAFNLPSKRNQLEESSVSVLYVVGGQTDITRLNSLEKGVEINNHKGFAEAQIYLNPNFSSFTVSKEQSLFLSSLSPIQVPFSSSYGIANSTEVALFQKIGPVVSKYPLLAFNKKNGTKYGFLLGEGIWRWKLQDYSLNETNDRFNELFTQTAQYLISKEDKSLFRVLGETAYSESEKIKFEAETYNKSYELVNNAEVSMTILNEQKEEFSYLFSKVGDRYGLTVGILPPGNYSYAASTMTGGEKMTKTGEFSVSELKLEQNNSLANHQLLFNMSAVSGGELVQLEEMNSIVGLLDKSESMSDVIFQEKDIDDLINIKSIFFFLLILLVVEWFVRKRNGGY